MVNVQIKIVEEGMHHSIENLRNEIARQLFEDDIVVSNTADLTLKIKFTNDNGQDLVLLQLRESGTKNKISEKVIHYLEESWIQDTAAEAHALVASMAGITH